MNFGQLTDLIKIPPGVRCTLKMTTADGKEHVLIDVWNPKFETEDDGSKGAPNTANQFLHVLWFPGEVFVKHWYLEVMEMMAEGAKAEYEERIRVLESEVKALEGERERLNHELQHGQYSRGGE